MLFCFLPVAKCPLCMCYLTGTGQTKTATSPDTAPPPHRRMAQLPGFVPKRRENNSLEMKTQRAVNHFLIFVPRNLDELSATRLTRPGGLLLPLGGLGLAAPHSAETRPRAEPASPPGASAAPSHSRLPENYVPCSAPGSESPVKCAHISSVFLHWGFSEASGDC